MNEFKREERYMVIKLSRLSDEECSDGLTREETIWRAANFGEALVECVVVESDWPIYEQVWKLVEDCEKQNEEV